MNPKSATLSTAFAAIDFETADYDRDSACSLAIVTVEDNQIVDRTYALIRPPRKQFIFTDLHGISWQDVKNEPTFAELWPQFEKKLTQASFIAAHNASFDKGVLYACCETAAIEPPHLTFRCTVQLARAVWNIRPTKLSNVCSHLNIPLQHHHALSDAEACAKIVIAARERGAVI
ncbi:3'-5' exonuclease [Deltaproteobacteria bacterium TL4]